MSGDGVLILPPNFLVKSSTLSFLAILLPESGLTSELGLEGGRSSLWSGLMKWEGLTDEPADPPELPSTSGALFSNLFIRFEIREVLVAVLGLLTELLVTFWPVPLEKVTMVVGFGALPLVVLLPVAFPIGGLVVEGLVPLRAEEEGMGGGVSV